jgi:putative transposase
MNTNMLPSSFLPGTEVEYDGRRGRVTHMLDFESVLVADAEDGKPRRVYVSRIKPVAPPDAPTVPEPQLVPDEDWRLAEKRFELVRPLLDPKGRTRADVEKRAAECGIHANTLYRWIALYETQGRITALLPKERSDKGMAKLSPEVEEIVRSVIEDEYLTRQAKSVSSVYRIVESRCAAARLEPPHCNTLRNRIAALSAELKLARRRGKQEAEKFVPVRGLFPGADSPLSVVQIDHTKLDLVLVDDVRRCPIGRPWITLAIDVFSRMVAGFYVSFDPPGALATGLCLACAILPKDKWLARREITGEWPLWGIPAKVHADNAKEFRGNMLQRACKQYGIDLEWRPVARPHFGGHIERLLGTLLKEIHTLPGTTFTNTQERGRYDSEGRAVMTLGEFENWLATYVVEVYHKRVHSALGMSPARQIQRRGVRYGRETGDGAAGQDHGRRSVTSRFHALRRAHRAELRRGRGRRALLSRRPASMD